jgi:hypothetical protein
LRIEYIAGFFDGEGSIGIYRYHGGKFYLRTQLSQNKSRKSELIFAELKRRFGGHYSEQRTLSGGIKYNWQLHGIHAAKFLKKIWPYLLLKKQQAIIALVWQDGRPKPSRNSFGHFVPYPRRAHDLKVSRQLKKLKE